MEKIILKSKYKLSEQERVEHSVQLNSEFFENDILLLPNYIDLIGVITDDTDSKICIINSEVIENGNEQ